MRKILILTFGLLYFSINLFSQEIKTKDSLNIKLHSNLNKIENQINDTFPIRERIRLDSVKIDTSERYIEVYFNRSLSFIPIRENTLQTIYSGVKQNIDSVYRNYNLKIFSHLRRIERYLPNYYRNEFKPDKDRTAKPESPRIPTVRNISDKKIIKNGLQNRNIALWHSHGWYYEPSLNRWEWQRARLFQTVEDLYTMSYTIPYLVPMLENAGANVFLPRERDLNTDEYIVDNDNEFKTKQEFKIPKNKKKWKSSPDSTGFAFKPAYAEKENPFRQGTYNYIETNKFETKIQWIPNFRKSGKYGVYISYATLPESITNARYTVYHSGGKTEFSVNQKQGGGTWIYLGKFHFLAGKNFEKARVELSSENCDAGIITADAVRFGGGMGKVLRNGKTGNRPAWTEAARYYLQYAGMPDSIVYNTGKDEVWDDILARGKWVNYLKGSFYDTTITAKGLNIPIDMALAFHTDAGITTNDSTIGTLAIFDTKYTASHFPDNVSRFANRDLADLIQTQIVNDIRAKYNKNWTRRGLWDKEYAGARTAAVPTMLLELLSHQNLEDMKYGQNPQFRFDVSRAIYKAMLRFLSVHNGFDYVVQPLPVKYFSAEFNGKNSVKLKWKPTVDSLESSAVAGRYKIYISKNGNGFDNGRIVNSTEFIHENIEKGAIYRYKVTALNNGGESFPSEILSVCNMGNDKPTVLIVNAFDRVSAPATVESESFKGFANFIDAGVADKYDLHFIGNQYDFNPKSEWLDDDSPGWGASNADFETKITPGNTFDFPFIHGKAIKNAGYSFVSCSDECVENKQIVLSNYKIVDIIFGEEKETEIYGTYKQKKFKVFNESLKEKITDFCESGGNLLLSGAYIGSDLTTKADKNFAKEVLGYKWRTNHADVVGGVYAFDKDFSVKDFKYNSAYSEKIYTVEAPDGIEPANKKAKTIFRYKANNISAGVAFAEKYKVVVLGFPFETVSRKNELMKQFLKFLNE